MRREHPFNRFRNMLHIMVLLALVTGPGLVSTTEASLVTDRYIFYNNSSWDGNDPSANAADDLAIAPDKTALLSGQTATFANYTSYNRGINGIMIDILGLPGVPAASDFDFLIGDGSTWTSGPAPSSISVRSGAGTGGSDRITVTWSDAEIVNQWLSISVLPTIATGLTTADIFYFGNLVGDTEGDGIVFSDDLARVLSAQLEVAAIDDPLDLNRDQIIFANDAGIVAANQLNTLSLFTAPEAPSPIPVPAAVWLFGTAVIGLFGLSRTRKAV